MRAAWISIATIAAASLAAACGSTAEDGPLRKPDRVTFPLVNDALARRCATIDCHGSTERNLRLYSASGLRLDPAGIPGEDDTTEAEYDASYRSVIGLEPEVMSAVVADEGRDPERLTMVRKARGTEYHRPGPILVAGDAADMCVLSWLASAIDEARCTEAAEFEAPPSSDDAP